MPHDSFAVELLSRLWEISWQSALIAGLILMLQIAFGRVLGNRWRHALWLLVLARLLLPVLPQSHFSLFSAVAFFNTSDENGNIGGSPASISANSNGWVHGSFEFGGRELKSVPSDPPEHKEAIPIWQQPDGLFLLWLMIALGLIARLAIVNFRFSRSLAMAKRHIDPTLAETLAACCGEMGLTAAPFFRAPKLIVTDLVDAPGVCGILHPTILLPVAVANTLTDAQLGLVFLHELAHIKCCDVAFDWLWALLQSLHWFNPVLWMAGRLRRNDRELARDEMVLSLIGTAQANRYGVTLLELARPVRLPLFCPGLIGILSGKKQLMRRVNMVAKFKCRRTSLMWLGIVVLMIAGGCALTSPRHTQSPGPPPHGSPAADTKGGGDSHEVFNTIDDSKHNNHSLEKTDKTVATRNYDITDLLWTTPNYYSVPNLAETGTQQMQSYSDEQRQHNPAPVKKTRAARIEEIKHYITDNVDNGSWAMHGGTIASISPTPSSSILQITQTPQNHQKIRALLESLRKRWKLQISLETRFIILNDADESKLPVAIKQRLAAVDGAGWYRADQILSTKEVNAMVRAVDTSKSTIMETSPRTTVFNGQNAVIVVQAQQAYVSGMTAIADPNKKGTMKYVPITSNATGNGITEKLVALADSNHGSVFVDLHFQSVRLLALLPSHWAVAPANVNAIIQQPAISVTTVDRAVAIPDGGTVLLGGVMEVRPVTPAIRSTAIDRKIATLAEQDSHRHAYLLVKATILRQGR